MKPINELLNAFVTYYGEGKDYPQYPEGVMAALVKKYSYFPAYYIEPIYDRVIEEHPRRWGLPGVAEIHKAVVKAGPPESYRPPTNAKQIEAPADTKDFTDRIAGAVAEAAGKKTPNEIIGDAEEPNHFERQRIRTRIMKGDATDDEIFWMRVIDEYGGDWMAARKALIAI